LSNEVLVGQKFLSAASLPLYHHE